MNNVYGGNNVYPFAKYGNNWGAVHPSLWPDHVRKDYEEGMAAGQRSMDEAFSTMSGMGIGPWEMGGWPRPPKQKKGSKGRKKYEIELEVGAKICMRTIVWHLCTKRSIIMRLAKKRFQRSCYCC